VDDTAILSPGNDPAQSSTSLKHYLNLIENWATKWCIRINLEKLVHVNFIPKKN